jgi:hypothetical protein
MWRRIYLGGSGGRSGASAPPGSGGGAPGERQLERRPAGPKVPVEWLILSYAVHPLVFALQAVREDKIFRETFDPAIDPQQR